MIGIATKWRLKVVIEMLCDVVTKAVFDLRLRKSTSIDAN